MTVIIHYTPFNINKFSHILPPETDDFSLKTSLYVTSSGSFGEYFEDFQVSQRIFRFDWVLPCTVVSAYDDVLLLTSSHLWLCTPPYCSPTVVSVFLFESILIPWLWSLPLCVSGWPWYQRFGWVMYPLNQ